MKTERMIMRIGIFFDNIDEERLSEVKTLVKTIEELFGSKAFVFCGNRTGNIKIPSIDGIVDFSNEKVERKCEVVLPGGRTIFMTAAECLTYCKRILIQRPAITDVYNQTRILNKCGVTDIAIQNMFDLGASELFSLKSTPYPYVEARWKQEFSNLLCRDEADEEEAVAKAEEAKKIEAHKEERLKKKRNIKLNYEIVSRLKKEMEERGLTIPQVVKMSGNKLTYPLIYNFFHNGVDGTRPKTAAIIEEFLASLK